MSEVTVSWEWTLESPLHCGSGISQAGFADRLIQRDEHGEPLIVGDAVKGALRLSAEQIFAWLGNPQEKSVYGQVAEPAHRLLAQLFGGTSCAAFESARMKTSPEGRSRSTRLPGLRLPGTAIDRETGRAADNTLRTVEVLALDDAVFTGCCRLWPRTTEDEKGLLSLLLAALAATESIGGKAGIGWGRVKLGGVQVAERPVSALDGSALADLCKLIGTNESLEAAKKPTCIVAKTNSDTQRQWYRLEIELTQPLCLGSRPDVANKQTTLDYVPASALRGALRAAWLRGGVDEEEVAFRIGDDTRWTNAHPAVGGKGDAVPSVPVPCSYSCDKQDRGFGSKREIFDAMSDTEPEEYDAMGTRLQWRPMTEGWMQVEPASPGGALQIALYNREGLIESRMHVARNYATGSKREGALFARDAITPTDRAEQPRHFVAYACAPVSRDAWPEVLYVGKRTSAGYGRVKLKVCAVEGPWPNGWVGKPHPGNESCVIVQLLSDVVLRDESGAFRRSIAADSWPSLLGDNGAPRPLAMVARAAIRQRQHWMSTWGHGRAATTCLVAGSTWRLRFSDAKEAGDFRDAVTKKMTAGLGERTHEGFGWFVVDPPWLGRRYLMLGGGSAGAERQSGSPHPWPGCEGIERSRLVEMVGAIKTVDSSLRGPLQELAARAREKHHGNYMEVLHYCETMVRRGDADSAKAYAWKLLKVGEAARTRLNEAVADPVPREQRPAFLRFTLDALLARCPKDGGES